MKCILPSSNVQEGGKQKSVEPSTSQRGTSPRAGEKGSRVYSSYDDAIVDLKLSVENAKEKGNRAEEGRAYGDLGTVYRRIGHKSCYISL